MPLKAHSVDNAPALMPDLYYRPKESVSMGCGLAASQLCLKVSPHRAARKTQAVSVGAYLPFAVMRVEMLACDTVVK